PPVCCKTHKPLFGKQTQFGVMCGSKLVADLGRVLFEPLAPYVAVVDDMGERRFFVPRGCLEEIGKVGYACKGFLRTCLAQWVKSRRTILTFGA
ncbi:MAG: hypothetical protein ACKPKO_62090, partial [Candidatus Fonsibacter sp.]